MARLNGTYYLAGPMTGIPQFNFPAFDAMAAELRAAGATIISPAEMDDPETRRMALASEDGAPGTGSANGETWGDFLARDVKLIGDHPTLTGIVVMPGWEQSRGARLETFVGHLKGLTIYRYVSGAMNALVAIGSADLLEAWAGDAMWEDLLDEMDEWTR